MTTLTAAASAPAPATKITPTTEQIEATTDMLTYLADPKRMEYRLGGPAGTGKTTLLKFLLSLIRPRVDVAISAFTGKAVMVLRTKDIPDAQTMHRLLYTVTVEKGRVLYTPKVSLPFDLVIVDEGSMVNTSLYDDLRRHEVKRLIFGDPFQLEPVGDNPNLMAEPDFVLTEIHRQAALSPIIRLATYLRSGKSLFALPDGVWGNDEHGTVTICQRGQPAAYREHDVTICGFNNTRHAINAYERRKRGFSGEPQVGESIICLANNREMGVFNGLLTTIKQIDDRGQRDGIDYMAATLSDEMGTTYEEVPILLSSFGQNFDRADLPRWAVQSFIPFDFGYCLTTHKSQGSEWTSVRGIVERLPRTNFQRWLYTLATRAMKHLTLVR